MLEDLAVWYLFLGGTGAGLLFVAAVLESLTPQAVGETGARLVRRYAPKTAYRRFFGPAYGIGVAVVALGMFCLLLDMGRSDRVFLLFVQPTPSFITVGAFSLVALVAFALFFVAIWTFGALSPPRVLVRILLVLAIVAAFAVMAYTGLFLSSMPAVPLWASPWIPPLFVASSLSTGTALLVCLVVLSGSDGEFRGTLRRLQKADAVVIACELAILSLFVVSALMGGDVARASAVRLLQGDLAAPFLGLVVLLGLAMPLACEAFGRRPRAGVALASGIFVLAGGFLLRWCIVQAGTSVDIATAAARALGIQ